MKLTKTEFETLRTEIETALASVAAKYGCVVEAGNIKYDDINTDIVVSLRSKGENGKSADQMNFEKYCGQFGFKPEDYGFTFTDKNKTYTFVGFNPRARKNYCLLRCEGTTYTTSPDGIKFHMAMKGVK